jgi:hypothetical protein
MRYFTVSKRNVIDIFALLEDELYVILAKGSSLYITGRSSFSKDHS